MFQLGYFAFSQANPIVDRGNLGQSVNDREALRTALVAAQESAAVHILLECCLPRDDSEKVRTTQSLFIDEFLIYVITPNLIKLCRLCISAFIIRAWDA